MRTVFSSSFTFVAIRANLKQKDSCVVWLGANFEEQHGCARCLLQVLSRRALHNFNVFRPFLTKGAHFKQSQSCAKRFNANFTQNHSCTGFFHKIYQKQPIEVPLILLTTKTNIGKLKVARSLLAQPNLCDMRTLFWTNMVNLKMSSHFWPNKPIEENLHNGGEFEDVSTFLIKHAHLSKFTVARPLFNNFKLFNKSRQF